MIFEIEHKFLVKNDSWRKDIIKSSKIKQGYFNKAPGYSLRVRIIDNKAILTLKGGRCGIGGLTRTEFEYDIPVMDALFMMNNFCGDRIIEKTRYFLDAGNNLTWEIDEYFGKCQGLFTAELEVPNETTFFEKPDWLGLEVSRREDYSNRALASLGLPKDFTPFANQE